MKDNVARDKSYKFAFRIIKLYKFLCKTKHEFELSKQILRSGTSIGANIEEAIGGQSEKDFLAKLSIAYKETRETHYWLRLLYDSDYIDQKAFVSMINECDELLKLLGSIQKTIRARNS